MSLSPSPSTQLSTGGSAVVGRYTLLFRFAAGGMAEVYVARMAGEGGFEKPVAIKRMLPALAEEPRFVDMFLDEARIAAMVSSPHVVPTLDVGKDEDGAPYIVMELVTGLSLAQLLRALVASGTPPPIDMIVEILVQTAHGLEDAHTARRPTGEPLELVHRDVSPQNVLIGTDGRARLTDFGVARAVQRVTRTTTGEVKGKLSYFSPEQARNQPLDQRSDVFALGIVAWEALAGRRLFQRDDPMTSLRAVLEEPIPTLLSVRPDVPEALSVAVATALARDREARFSSAGELAQAMRGALGGTAHGTPTRTVLGRWIESLGGEKLKGFQSKVAAAFGAASARSGEKALDVPVVVDAVAEPSASAVRLVGRDATSSSSTPRVAPVAPSEPPRRRSWTILAVAVVLVAVGVAVAVGWSGSTDIPVAAEVPAPPERAAETVTATGTAPPARVEQGPVVPPPLEAREEVPPRVLDAPPPTTARPVLAHARPEAPSAVPPSAAPPTEASRVDSPSDDPPRVDPPRPRAEPRAPTPPPTTTAQPAEPSGARRRLLGVDHFERETAPTP